MNIILALIIAAVSLLLTSWLVMIAWGSVALVYGIPGIGLGQSVLVALALSTAAQASR